MDVVHTDQNIHRWPFRQCVDFTLPVGDLIFNLALLMFLWYTYLNIIHTSVTDRTYPTPSSTHSTIFVLVSIQTLVHLIFGHSPGEHASVVPCIKAGHLRGFKALGAVIGLVQAASICLAALALLVLAIVASDVQSTAESRIRLEDGLSPSAPATGKLSIVAKICAVSICILQIVFVLIPAISILFDPATDGLNRLGQSIIRGMIVRYLLPLSTALAVLDVLLTVWSKHQGRLGADLDPRTHAAQAGGFFLLAISLVARFGWPWGWGTWPGLPYFTFLQSYVTVLGPSVNYTILGVGQALLCTMGTSQ